MDKARETPPPAARSGRFEAARFPLSGIEVGRTTPADSRHRYEVTIDLALASAGSVEGRLRPASHPSFGRAPSPCRKLIAPHVAPGAWTRLGVHPLSGVHTGVKAFR